MDEPMCRTQSSTSPINTPIETVWDSVLLTLQEPQERIEPGEPIPVTVFAGFLGSGKTTLLCRLLESTTLTITAIVNDLAAVNVDAEKIRHTTAETIEFENGCACCVLSGDLGLALAGVSQRDAKPDAVVIEASGVSDPTGIAQTIASVDGVILDGIVTVVDGQSWAEQILDPTAEHLFRRQLEAAHMVIVTKCEPRAEDYAGLCDLVPGRAVLSAAELTDADASEFLLGAVLKGARLPIDAHSHDTSAFASEVISWHGQIEARAFMSWLDAIPSAVYRIKGVVNISEQGELKSVEVQAVGRRWRIAAATEVITASSIVTIGAQGDSSYTEHSDSLRKLVKKAALEEGPHFKKAVPPKG
jgi:G3E family GTPase